MELAIGFVATYAIGVLMGYILAKVLSKPKSIGCLRIDNSDGDGPYLFLELDKGVRDISKAKYANVEIKNVSYLPHE